MKKIVYSLVVAVMVSSLWAAPTIDGRIDPTEGWIVGAANSDTTDQAGADLDTFYYYITPDTLYLAIKTQNRASWDVAYGFAIDVDQKDSSGYIGDPAGTWDSWGRHIIFANEAPDYFAPDYQIYFWYSGADGITSDDYNRYNGAGWECDFAPLIYQYSRDTLGLRELELKVALDSLGNPHRIHIVSYIVGGDNSSCVDVLPYDSSVVLLSGGAEWTDTDTLHNYVEVLNYPLLTIPEIQDTTGTGSDASAHEGDTVATFGIVTGVYSNGFFLEEKPAVPWGGIWVYMSPPTVNVGDSIYIEGVVSEYYGLTELKDIQDFEVLASSVSLPDPITVTTGEANDEQYEGVLLTTKGICTNPDLGYGEWQIDDGTGPLRVDDMGLAFTPDSGVEYAIAAPLYYSFGDFKLEPRDSSDIVAYAYTHVKINEVYYDSPGSDQGLFVELYGPPGMPLDNMMLVGINGATGLIYETVDLSGDTIPLDGFFVAAQDTTVPNYDKITGVDWQNGPDNIQLWYIDGSDTIIVDAIGYGDSDTTTWEFRGEGLPAPDVWGGRSLVRFPDGKDTDDNSVDFHPTVYRTPGLSNKIAIFFDDFEAGTGNWIGDWENTAEDAYSGDSSYTDTANANYPNDANLIGQLADPLDLSEYPSYTLEFWTKHYIEDGWDFGYVEVSTDSVNWTKIDSLTGDSVNWYPVSLDLSAFAGDSTVWIRFRLESDTYVNEAGWFVDDVAVIANLSDNSPPLISHTRPPYPPEGQTSAVGDITITATILDYSPIAADTLYYNVDGGSITAAPHDSVVTDSLGNVIYYYTIPAQPSGALVTYYFTAVDTAGNSATTSTYRYYAGELISYDDGEPEYVAYVYNTDTLAVQFGSTLVDTFTRITSVLFYFYNAVGIDSFYVHVWDANGNDVVTPIIAYQDTSNPNLSWTVVDLRPYEIYIFPGTDLYVGYTTMPGDSVPAILFDSPASFYHSYLLQSGTWQLINSDLFIRVLTEKTTEVHEGLTTLPKVFMLGPNYPNPFRGQTVIKYALPKDAHVTLEIYDITGRKVKTLVNSFEKAGWKTAIWNGTNERGEKVKSGIYFYRMKADKFLKTRKMVFVK